MIRAMIWALGAVGGLCAAVAPGSAQEREAQPVTVTAGPHWDVAFVRQVSRDLRCPGDGAQAQLTLTLAETGKARVFYTVSALTIEGEPVGASTLAAINRGIAEYDAMPEVVLQCAGKGRRVALVGAGRTAGREIIVPLPGER